MSFEPTNEQLIDFAYGNLPETERLQVEQAITSRNLILRVENGTMPPSGNLSAAQVQSIKDWQTEGFPN